MIRSYSISVRLLPISPRLLRCAQKAAISAHCPHPSVPSRPLHVLLSSHRSQAARTVRVHVRLSLGFHPSPPQPPLVRSLWTRARRGLALFSSSLPSSSPPSSSASSSSTTHSPRTSSAASSSSSSSSSSNDTIPLTSDGNLDAELGEAMAATGADLSTPVHHMTQNSDPTSTLTALEIDEQGNHAERDYHPLQLARRFGLHPRDMRFLDSSLRNLPSLLVRREVIIVNLELFKAIISAKEVLMFDPWYPHIQSIVPLMKHALTALHIKKDGATATAAAFTSAGLTDPSSLPPNTSTAASSSSELPSHLPSSASPASAPHGPSVREMAADVEGAFRDRSLHGLRDQEREYEEWMEPRMPFEFIALELILMTVTRTLESRFEVYNSSLSPLLNSSSSTLNEGSTLMHLLQLKNGLTSFEVVLEETGMAIKQVLQDDRDMLDMFLTMKARGETPRIDEHGEIEVLLETYLRKVDELENEVRTNVKSISLTEEHIQIRLDTVRNAMMKVDLLVTICTFGVATAALIASTFGMNLTSHLEQSPVAFYITSAVMLVLAAALIKFGLRLCRQHKIDLFHVEPEEPKLRLPVNSLKKHKRRASPVHRLKAGEKGKAGEEEMGLYDRSDWYDRGRTLEWKLEQLEAMKAKQEHVDRWMQQGNRWKSEADYRQNRKTGGGAWER